MLNLPGNSQGSRAVMPTRGVSLDSSIANYQILRRGNKIKSGIVGLVALISVGGAGCSPYGDAVLQDMGRAAIYSVAVGAGDQAGRNLVGSLGNNNEMNREQEQIVERKNSHAKNQRIVNDMRIKLSFAKKLLAGGYLTNTEFNTIDARVKLDALFQMGEISQEKYEEFVKLLYW